MFKKYKAAHGGRGPMENLYANATGGVGLFGRLGLQQERDLTDQLIADVSSHEEFRGLEGLLEVGRSPLTREQHAEFRAGVLQAALDTRVFNAGMTEYSERTKSVRAQAVSKEDHALLDNFDAMASHAQRLAAAGHSEKATEIFGTVLQNFTGYVSRNEEQRLEIESAERAGRDKKRDQLQTVYDQHVLAPTIQDEANFSSLMQQLSRGKGEEVAPNTLVSAYIEYVGGQLRGSDDGNWSFSLGPVGLSDAAVPTMTYSQLRNGLNDARQGRRQVLDGLTEKLRENAKLQGFDINGTSVEDLLFPLASAHFASQEPQIPPPSIMPKLGEGEAQPSGKETPQDVARDTLIGLGDIYQYARGNWRNQFEYLFNRKPAPLPPLPTPGDARPGNTRRGRGSVAGIIERRPTND